MPNVMGREFPYTPEGMAAAQQYAAAVGMRGGGMMGFRPLGMEEGGDATAEAIVRDLYNIMRKGTTAAVKDFIDANRADLEMIARENPDPMFNMLRSILPDFPPADLTPTLPEAQEALPDPLMQPDSPMIPEALRRLFETPNITGFVDEQGQPEEQLEQDPTIGKLRIPEWLREAERKLLEPELVPEWRKDPRFEGYYNPDQLNPYFDPNEIVLADGGYIGRGTMAGELSPRGSMSVREEGETMREMAKRMGKRNGGIMSLRRY